MTKNPIINIKELGWAELLVAVQPILTAYYLGPLPFSCVVLLFLSVVAIFRGRVKVDFHLMLPMLLFMSYWFFHEFLLLFVADNYNINKRIAQMIFFVSLLLVVPMLDYKKLVASVNLVSVICIIGLIFQLSTIMSGGTVHPLEIPGLTMSQERLESESLRPSSFFMEPASYTVYMFAPLMISLINRKFWWSAILIISMYLTTSTTALFSSFVFIIVYVVSQGVRNRRSILMILLAFVLYYALNNMSIFEFGMNKLENTDFETNIRIAQGLIVISTMQWYELLLGVPYGSSMDYYLAGRTVGKEVVALGSGLYMSTTWNLIFSFGIVGLLLYLNIYYRLYKICRILIPYIICLFVIMFSASIGIGAIYIYTMIVLYVIATNNKPTGEIINKK